jgi:hypothetical protein
MTKTQFKLLWAREAGLWSAVSNFVSYSRSIQFSGFLFYGRRLHRQNSRFVEQIMKITKRSNCIFRLLFFELHYFTCGACSKYCVRPRREHGGIATSNPAEVQFVSAFQYCMHPTRHFPKSGDAAVGCAPHADKSHVA